MTPIPLFLNPSAGTADALRDAVHGDARFALEEVAPGDMAAAVRQALDAGAERVAVAGGDGSVVAAAGALLDASGRARAELAVLPAGTLNHFARHLGIPLDPAGALDVAAAGEPCDVDVAYVGDRLFVNTSAVGAYVVFVRLRERLEPRFGYWLSSLLAGLRLLFRMPTYRVEVEVEGRLRAYETPLVFVGVGERALEAPTFAELVAQGRPGLHVVVVRGRRRARLLALALAAARGGVRAAVRMPEVDSFVVERCRVGLRRGEALAATDGEIVRLPAPLEYRVVRGALRVVAPAELAAQRAGRAAAGADAAARASH